ncbi:hypothetical protein LSTR_LSTR003349 [Laodelphax striatellus]|uniref:Uncharacterized protein n=1 Tax=Laodelphax striatellus TaxID=195883 RepID=A0A482X4P3_LAOST|nr:hypothetical protein LSTR_LSTR016333 [Laodelphax striatellus]RZF40839.1 hypothetical protein LSTR_LSTR003349 [Laodelphax striatellus]
MEFLLRGSLINECAQTAEKGRKDCSLEPRASETRIGESDPIIFFGSGYLYGMWIAEKNCEVLRDQFSPPFIEVSIIDLSNSDTAAFSRRL